MRAEFVKWASEFPSAVAAGDQVFPGSAVVQHVVATIPKSIAAALGAREKGYEIVGSAGQGGWTHTPWVALLDPAATTTVQEGLYVVYLLSADGERLYLTLNQGCTTLKNAVGIPGARVELESRAATMRAKLGARLRADLRAVVHLGSNLWRAGLYQAGTVAAVQYDTANPPSDAALVADLKEVLKLYSYLRVEGSWSAEDEIVKDAIADGVIGLTLEQAKRYRQHRSLERQPSHSRAVKRALGTICMGCDNDLGRTYGPIGSGLIHAHHLTPLAGLVEGVVIRLDPRADFAVLCPNCHAIIHRMADVSDIAGLRSLIMESP